MYHTVRGADRLLILLDSAIDRADERVAAPGPVTGRGSRTSRAARTTNFTLHTTLTP